MRQCCNVVFLCSSACGSGGLHACAGPWQGRPHMSGSPSLITPTPTPMPGLKHLYRHDRIIAGAAHKIAFGVMVAAGMWWISQPQPNAVVTPSAAEQAFEAQAIQWAAIGGLVMSAISALVLAWRFARVKKILASGITVKGTVEELGSVAFRKNSRSTSKPTYRHTRFVNLRYAIHGAEQQVRLWLPNTGFSYGLVEGREIDLLVLETAPRKPLIRAMYTVENEVLPRQ